MFVIFKRNGETEVRGSVDWDKAARFANDVCHHRKNCAEWSAMIDVFTPFNSSDKIDIICWRSHNISWDDAIAEFREFLK